MENQRRVMCPENEDLASFMWKMSQEMADPKGISERTDATLYKAYCKVCSSKTPIKTLKEFSQIKGVGKWTLRLLQGFFKTDSNNSESEEQSQKGKKIKGTKRYVPQKNSVAYALLITLYRSTVNGSAFMRKQELIDAAEESGLSRVPIAPELGQGKRGRFGSSPREWYSGWNCMKTLITKGLVVRSSNPAKYMLTQEGKEAVMGCLSRSGLVDCTAHLDTIKRFPSQDVQYSSDLTFALTNLVEQKVTLTSVEVSSQGKSVGAPIEFLEKFTHMGYSEMQIQIAFAKVSQATQNKETSSIWSAVLHHLRKDQVDAMLSECGQALGKDSLATSTTSTFKEVGRADFVEENNQHEFPCGGAQCDSDSSYFADSAQSSFILQACSSSDYSKQKSLNSDGVDTNMNAVMMPPLNFGERFVDVYDVILILDDREQFAKNNKGYRSRKIIENICTEFKIQIEVRRLAIGDGIWIARHKHLEIEYVLDFIVERKEVDDLRSSIRDNRYRDQKLRLLRCGLQKLIYVVEGDPNSSEAAESIKTACFTTEILEEFDVQRTGGLGDTLRKYGFLTQAIIRYYSTQISTDRIKNSRICPSFEDFTKKCQDLEKVTVSDVFAVQLMQVPQVTEEIALAVRNLYPTLFSLAHAYSQLEGDVNAQEDMLKKLSNNLISGVASRNIFRLVWGCWKD